MFFIYHPRATLIRRIARELQQPIWFPEVTARNIRRNGVMRVHVNWGCGPQMLRRFTAPINAPVLNLNISGSTRKIRTFDLLRTANLPIPRVVTDPREVLNDDPRPFYARGKYLARKDGLRGGEGIVVYERGQLPEGEHDFFAQVVSKACEVRMHVAGGAIICEQIKYVPAGSHVLIRNFDNGARFSARNIATEVGDTQAEEARRIAIAATTACGLDFGALDMALTKGGNWVIFEINSAPGLMQREDTEQHDVPCTYEAYLTYFRSFRGI